MQEEKGRADKAAERIRAIKVWRGEAADRASSAREMRVARNRYVLRAHERLLRDMNRLKEDDRTRRMEALKVTGCPDMKYSSVASSALSAATSSGTERTSS